MKLDRRAFIRYISVASAVAASECLGLSSFLVQKVRGLEKEPLSTVVVTKEPISAAILRNQSKLKELIQSRVTGINSQQLDQLFQSSQYGQLVDLFSEHMVAIINGCLVFVGEKQTTQEQTVQALLQLERNIQQDMEIEARVKQLTESVKEQAKEQDLSQKQSEILHALNEAWDLFVVQAVSCVGVSVVAAQSVLQMIKAGRIDTSNVDPSVFQNLKQDAQRFSQRLQRVATVQESVVMQALSMMRAASILKYHRP